MSRRHRAVRRKINPDAKYGNEILGKFINCLMYQGKKAVAEKAVYGAFDIIEQRSKRNALEVFIEAINNARPLIEVRSRRVGGATYQVPMEVRDVRSLALAIRWLINASRKRGEKTVMSKVAGEILDAASGKGSAIKKREETHKMAEANKAFSHYRW